MIYRLLLRYVLRHIDAERTHRLAARTLNAAITVPGVAALMRRSLAAPDPALAVNALGLRFASPLGVAAGVDKEASWFEALTLLGFGAVEIGTVTARPQAGSPRPRIMRLPADRALHNWMGFPNPGADAIAMRLSARSGAGVIGANIGKSAVVPADEAIEDFREAARRLIPLCEYLAVNVSSPNTPGLRDLQHVDRLRALLLAMRDELDRAGRPLPLLVKIAPDLTDTEIDAIADLAVELGLDGIIATNTTIDRTVLRHPARIPDGVGGGISGAPLAPRALAVLTRLHARVGGRIVLVSVGGIETVADALERIRAGATLIQANTGFVYGGPLWPMRINRGLARAVAAAGVDSIADLAGSATPPAATTASG